MKYIKIKNKKYCIPQNWMDINLELFIKIKEHEKLIDSINRTDYNLEFCSIITGINKDILISLDSKTKSTIIKLLQSITNSEIKLIEEPIYKFNGITYVMDKHTNEMTLGQFIDLDITNRVGDAWSNAHKIASSFMRPAKLNFKSIFKRKNICDDYIIESYDSEKTINNYDLFLKKIPMPYITTSIVIFSTFLDNFKSNYEGLFSTGDEEPKEMNVTATLINEYNERWNWYSLVRQLANGDLSRFDEVTKWNVYRVFNDLSYLKETDNHKRYLNESSTTTNKRK